ncbi:unnamed protein product, partial [marine sediment metagenome]
VIDDSDKKRSKSTKSIFKVHKIKDKASGGYIMGQSIVFLFLVTPIVSIPISFEFYMPDPRLTAWYKSNKKLKKQGVPKKKRPKKPKRSDKYPTKQKIALNLLNEFKRYNPIIKIKCVLADALYGTNDFLTNASNIFDGIQVISQLRSNQNIRLSNNTMNLEEYFTKHPGSTQEIKIRGGEKTNVTVGSARLYIVAHGRKRLVIALRYEGEEEYRYLVSSDMSWQHLDIVKAYTLRWLIEVFFQDWKSYEGWGQLTKQPDEDGSSKSLILSLLLDHCLLIHPEQLARL